MVMHNLLKSCYVYCLVRHELPFSRLDLMSLCFADKSGSQNATPLPNNHSVKENAAEDELPSAIQARASVATALGVAAANAKLLADQEEREIEHLVANIIDNQVGISLM